MRWIAALPMYDLSERLWTETAALFGTLLAGLRADGFQDAVELMRDPPLPDLFTRPDLLLAQTCGYPYMTGLRAHLRLVATPVYAFPGCRGADHASAIVVRADACAGIATLAQARGRIAAVNSIDSNSGMNALRHAVAPLSRNGRFFGGVRWSGSHRASLAMLQNGAADLAAIDCVTLGYLGQEHPHEIDGLAVLGTTAPSPALPLVAGAAVPEAVVRHLRAMLNAPDAALRRCMDELSIHRFEALGDGSYASILALEAQACQQGYPQLG